MRIQGDYICKVLRTVSGSINRKPSINTKYWVVIIAIQLFLNYNYPLCFPGGSDGKESACSAGDPGSVPALERSHGEGNGYLLQCSSLENPMDRGAWWATVHGVAKSQT